MTNYSQTAKNYLADITGTKPLPDLEKLIKSEGLFALVPENVKAYFEEVSKAEKKGVDEYLCLIDKLPTNSCDVNKAISDREKGRNTGYMEWGVGSQLERTYFVEGGGEGNSKQPNKPITLPKNRTGINKSKKNVGNKLRESVVGQGARIKPEGAFYSKSITTRPDKDSRALFAKAVRGEGRLGIGDRAILFNTDGSVVLGTNAIRDRAVALERSSNIPSEVINNGQIPEIVKKVKYNAKNHPNVKRSARVGDPIGGIAALGGITALVSVIALLLPMHFITSAITFLTSITTFFTNVNNAVNTYLIVVDSLLEIFGIKGSSKAVKGFVAEIVDNALGGKENVQQVKNAFASGINSISVTTKLLENTQAIAARADDKVDGLALRLGGINNAMGEAGLIPLELQASSKAIDQLVDTRTKGDEELADNLTLLTGEIKDRPETTKELKTEQELRDKTQAKINKDLKDVTDLLDRSIPPIDVSSF